MYRFEFFEISDFSQFTDTLCALLLTNHVTKLKNPCSIRISINVTNLRSTGGGIRYREGGVYKVQWEGSVYKVKGFENFSESGC